MQRIGASYVMKKVTDYVTAPPAEPAAPAEPAEGEATQEVSDDLDGQVITDEDGQAIGRARLVRGVAVYVISFGGSPAAELESCIGDPESRVFFHRVDDRISGLIYVPDPSRAPEPVEGLRAEDI